MARNHPPNDIAPSVSGLCHSLRRASTGSRPAGGRGGLPQRLPRPIEPRHAVSPLAGGGPLAPVPSIAQTTAPRGPSATACRLVCPVAGAAAILLVFEHLPAEHLALPVPRATARGAARHLARLAHRREAGQDIRERRQYRHQAGHVDRRADRRATSVPRRTPGVVRAVPQTCSGLRARPHRTHPVSSASAASCGPTRPKLSCSTASASASSNDDGCPHTRSTCSANFRVAGGLTH